MSDIVQLNVGGTLFVTSKSTLTSTDQDTNIFRPMLAGLVPVERMADGSIVIDRDPHTFEILLNILRGYPFDSSLLSNNERTWLHIDTDFYGYPSILPPSLAFPELDDVKFVTIKNRIPSRKCWGPVPRLSFHVRKEWFNARIVMRTYKDMPLFFLKNVQMDADLQGWLNNLETIFTDECGYNENGYDTRFKLCTGCKIYKGGIEYTPEKFSRMSDKMPTVKTTAGGDVITHELTLNIGMSLDIQNVIMCDKGYPNERYNLDVIVEKITIPE